MIDPVELVSELARIRRQSSERDDQQAEGVLWLRHLLKSQLERVDRYTVLQSLVTELKIGGNLEEASACARDVVFEFDDITSHVGYARTFLDLQQKSSALKEFESTFHLAILRGELVNFAFGEFMRAAVSVQDFATIDRAALEFLALSPSGLVADCRIETDWMDDAIALGANPQLVRDIRRRAARKSR